MMGAEVLGIKELSEALKRLGSSLDKKIGARMVASAGSVVKKEAKRIAQSKGLKKTGSLINNIAIKREKNVPSNTVQYNIGVRHGRDYGKKKNVVKYLAVGRRGRVVTKYKNDPFYWRFLEFGTKNISPRKFIEPALESKRAEAIDAMQKIVEKEILKART